jgi:WD40 repeat protein
MAAYGEEGTFGNDEAGLAAYEAFRPHLGGQTVWFSQEAAGEGLNFLMDVNGDGILDRVQQFMNLEEIDGPDYVGGPAFKVNLRNAAGEEYQRLEGNSFQDIIQAIAFQPYILSYIASHPDLIRSYGTDIMSAMPHFLANAEKLGITFDPASYLLANPDLVNAFGGDSVAAARHYIENGYDEGRATGLPDAATLAQQSAIQNDPGGVLSRLAVIAPSLWQITKTDLSAVTPGQVAETLNILMTISTATVPYILEAIAPGELYALAAADYSPPDASDLSGFQVVGDHIVSSQPSQTPASGELPDLSGLLSPGTSASTAMDGRLNSGEALLSANGRYAAVMRGDGNLVVYDYSTGHSIWQSGTNDAGSHLFMGSDGNLVIGRYVDAEFEKWSSGTGAAGVNRDFSLVMQDDGNLVVYDSQGNKGLWSSQGGLVAPAEAPFLLQTGTDYPETDGNSEFKFFDYNRDGRDDLVVIRKAGGAGTAEVHVYDGALNFAAPLLNTATMLPEADGTTEFEVADWNRDGRMDLVAIRKSGTGTGTTEVRVLDGATNFSTPLLETGTMLHEADDRFDFEVGDWNGDGRQDLFAIMKSQTGTGSTEVHIYDGATNFSSALLETGTGLGETNSDFEFDFADHNNDGRLDLVAVNRNEGGGTTELFVYDGTSNFATSLLQTGTVLGATDSRFEFEVTDWDRDGQADLAAIQKSGTGTGSSEVHILNGALGGGSAQSIAYDGPLILGDLIVNQELDAYQAIRSANGRYLALMQAAGNFVVYDQAENREIWASNTDGEAAGGRLVMQGDGNLVVYDAGGGAQWNSGSWGDGVSRDFSLVIQDDGNLVIYDSQGGEPLWSSVGGSVVRPETNA